MTELIRFLLLGLAGGAAYALLGLGIVVAYRASGVVNFAHGAVGLVGVAAYYEWRDAVGGPVAACAGVAAAALAGLMVQVIILRRMQKASPLMRVVATLAGLAIIERAVTIKFGSDGQFSEGIVPTRALQ